MKARIKFGSDIDSRLHGKIADILPSNVVCVMIKPKTHLTAVYGGKTYDIHSNDVIPIMSLEELAELCNDNKG